MPQDAIAPIVYDPSNTILPETGLSPSDLPGLAPWLDLARQEIHDDLGLWRDVLAKKRSMPDHKVPLDAGFTDLPERLLADYRAAGEKSEIGRIVKAAGRLREMVDRVAVLGIGGSYMGARAMFEALCHPYHNELARELRKGTPRIYFSGNNVDNEHLLALLDLLGRDHQSRFAALVISKSGGTLETAVAFRLFLNLLRRETAKNPADLRKLVVPVTGKAGRLRDLVNELKCEDDFVFPDGVGGRFSILTSVGLLPAAVMGLDIVRLLEGAAAMNAQFFKAAVGKNPVLDYVGVCHLMEVRRGATIRVLSTWGGRLEAVGLWYDQLLAESLGKNDHGATPLTVVNTRDLHSRGQQHQEGRRDKLITNLYAVSGPGQGILPVGESDLDQDQLNALSDKTVPQILQAALEGTNEAYRDALRPTADIRLPAIDEASLGQLFQMLMLATVVEGRLININPYGQPGVEAYKRNMNAILRGQSRKRSLTWPLS